MKGVRLHLSDRVVSWVSPVRAAKRVAARHFLNLSATYYSGASPTRLTSNWTTGIESADTTIDGYIETIRSKSRDLNRNNAIASGATGTVVNNTILNGLKPQSVIDSKAIGIDDEKAKAFQTAAEKVYSRWVPTASSDLQMNFNELQSLAVRQILESGESIFVRRAIKDPKRRPYLLALEAIEGDRLDDPKRSITGSNVKFGIEKDKNGVPSNYHFLMYHPGDSRPPVNGYNDSKPVPAYDSKGRPMVFHFFPRLRPGQSRGIPFFAPVLDTFKILADYMEAELVAARVGACFAAFVETDNPYTVGYGRSDQTNDAGQRLEGMEPGAIEYLAGGQKITFSDPKRPGNTFNSFVELVVRSIGAALGLPYELIFKDFSKTNYSSARAALLQAYRVFQDLQQLIIDHLCQPVYEILIEEAFLRGELPVGDFYRNQWEYTRALWTPPGWKSVDPLKETQANKIAVSMGFKSRADVCAESGDDWEQKATQIAREKDKYEFLGIPFIMDGEDVDDDEEEEAIPGQTGGTEE